MRQLLSTHVNNILRNFISIIWGSLMHTGDQCCTYQFFGHVTHLKGGFSLILMTARHDHQR